MKHLLHLLLLSISFSSIAQIVGPYNGTTYLSNITGPCNAATLAVLGDNDFTTNGTYEIAYGSLFSGTWASGQGYSDGPGADMLCVSLHTAEGWDVALKLSDGSTTATQLVDMVTVLDDVTWTMYNCAGSPTSNWFYDRRVAEVDFANYTIPAGLTVVGAEFTLNYDNAGYTDPVGILLLTSTTTQTPGITDNGPLCSGETLQLDITNVTADMVYSWTGPNGFSSTQQNPSLVFTSANAGVYDCVVTDTLTGDVFNLSTTVALNPAPSGTINYTGGCAGSIVSFGFTPAGGQTINSYNWDFGQGNPTSSNSATPSSTFAQGGNYVVSLDVTNDLGCSATIDTVVTINALPVIAFTYSPSPICVGQTVTFTNNCQNATSYTWDFGDGQIVVVTDQSDQTHSFLVNSVVTLVASNGQCSGSESVNITVAECGCTDPNSLNYDPLATVDDGSCVYPIPTVETPNVFTPDASGDNDLFFLTTTNSTNIALTIVNRWGELMFEASGINPAWDGKVNGADAAEGVYFYTYKVTGVTGELLEGHGFVELIRK